MIDSKKLAATPLVEFEPGSNEYYMALACHHDAGGDMQEMGMLLGKPAQAIAKLIEKGRRIRDRLIKEESDRMTEAVHCGEMPGPAIAKTAVVTRVAFSGIPRGLYVPQALAMLH